MNNNIALLQTKKQVYKSNNGKNIIYACEYNGEPCYLTEHTGYEHKELFDYDKRILNAVKSKINSCGSFLCDHKKNCDLFKFRDNYGSISLRFFLYAKYNGIAPRKVKGMKICLFDASLQKYNISDLRSTNLYEAGGIRPHTDVRDIDIICDADNGEKKYIKITFKDASPRHIEYTDYSKELYEMLTQSKFCNIHTGRGNGRGYVIVHYKHNKTGYSIVNLSRFIAVYKYFFKKYINRSGSIKLFINDFYKLNNSIPDDDVAHVNSCKEISLFSNIVLMDKNINIKLSDDIKLIDGRHKVYTAVNSKDEILIEYVHPDLLNHGKDTATFYKCKTPEDFLFWQETIIGKNTKTEKLTEMKYSNGSGEIQIELTPNGMRSTGKVNKKTAKENSVDFEEYVEHEKKLLSLDDSCFVIVNRDKEDNAASLSYGKGVIIYNFGEIKNVLTALLGGIEVKKAEGDNI